MCCSSGSMSTSTGASYGNIRIATGSVTNYGATSQLPIGAGSGFTFINVVRIKLKRTAGTAASFTPRLYDLSGAAAGSIDMQFEGSSTAVANLFDAATTGCVFRTNASGQFFLEPGPNAGADNAFNYEIYFEVL
jgi:hypothetical protein